MKTKTIFLIFITFLMMGCEEDDASIADLTTTRRFQLIDLGTQGVRFGNGIYSNANIYFSSESGFDLVAGQLEPNNNTNVTLKMSLELDRQGTIEYNQMFWSDIPFQIAQYLFYNGYKDMTITQADVRLTSKNGDAILFDEAGEYGVVEYPYGCGTGTPWGNGRFDEIGNTFGNLIQDDQNTFSENTTVDIDRFTDFRMLTNLRFLMSKSNTSQLYGLSENGARVDFSLDYSTDLLSLSDFLSAQNVVTLKFELSGDFNINLFIGTIRSDESPDGQGKSITVDNP
ncbi:hypothetical protein KORDIASMS9_02814 [Kordia sp. SMS9]|uniref:hypothetical protein n=1 Tax=Kordia sp. SMS9 TaxID=2282170 RepID=UPI000E104374|nr:hypothetical protein [Kordia sp. SMS9]AXG70574.1 hypothetical protein KORDIASMS9_02814 [Kordia sp. SMS9]